ncbi:hypothetical protein ABZP36_030945 [Zizania latifolia]
MALTQEGAEVRATANASAVAADDASQMADEALRRAEAIDTMVEVAKVLEQAAWAAEKAEACFKELEDQVSTL